MNKVLPEETGEEMGKQKSERYGGVQELEPMVF